MVGVAQDRATINKAVIAKETRLEYNIVPPKSFAPGCIEMTGAVQMTDKFIILFHYRVKLSLVFYDPNQSVL